MKENLSVLPTNLSLADAGLSWRVEQSDGTVKEYTWTGVEWMEVPKSTESDDSTDDILHEAYQIIHGQRQEQYGSAHKSLQRIAGMWSEYLGHEVTMLDVANLMILLKVSRTKGKFLRDSYVDICGYAALAEEIS